MEKITICWLRRDLRLKDQTALHHALAHGNPVLCLFIFDRYILDKLPYRDDSRVEFLHNTLLDIKTELKGSGSDLLVMHDTPLGAWKRILEYYAVDSVFVNRDYEPYAVNRDYEVELFLQQNGIRMFSFKDQVVFEKNDILKADGKPYTVYTPYSKKWLENQKEEDLTSKDCDSLKDKCLKINGLDFPSLTSLGFIPGRHKIPERKISLNIIRTYESTRNFPSRNEGTSRLGIHLRFGTLSIRKLVKEIRQLNETYLKELIWREFFMQILWHFPHSATQSFRKEYDGIEWINDPVHFERWQKGMTGYPIVDAGMRELYATGHMHNRVRMVTASFLCKHLLSDWRLGEQHFASLLLDYDSSANIGNWQWAAGSGCDAAPYFRVFNPETQAEKFDNRNEYIRRWVPEFDTYRYPKPIIEHKFGRERAIRSYKEGLERIRQ
jgi:deoxyribodipyrimidine photo-lyase